MTTPLFSYTSSSPSVQSFDQIKDWLRACSDPATSLEAPATTATRSLKRPRTPSQCTMCNRNTSRSSSPSKRRRKHGDPTAGQTASQTGSVALSDRTILTATSSAKQTSSPSRHLTQLRTAQPSIHLSPITMPPKPLPDEAMIRLGQLRKQLASALKTKYIPGGLKDEIEKDPDFQLSLSMEPIDEEAYDYTDERTVTDFALADTLQQVKKIFQGATLCTQYGRDENAWCFSVVWPLIELAIKLHGHDKWSPESVQSQSINPRYLSSIPDPSVPNKQRHLIRKTDFCFSYSYLNPHFRTLYKQLEEANTIHVSHTTDNFTSRAVLFSGIEVKPENGDQKEAELQMGIWMAASIRKKMELAVQAFEGNSFSTLGTGDGLQEDQSLDTSKDEPSVTALLEPALTIIGHEHKIYYAYPSSNQGDITILGPDEKLTNLSTRSVQGIFKLLVFYANILDYGCRRDTTNGWDSNGGLWGDYLEKVVTKMGGGICREGTPC